MSRYYEQYARAAYARTAQKAAPRIGDGGTAGPLADAYAVLRLRPGAPAAVVKAAYRALAAQCHPDVGGDPETMVRLNLAYATIQRHLDPSRS